MYNTYTYKITNQSPVYTSVTKQDSKESRVGYGRNTIAHANLPIEKSRKRVGWFPLLNE